MRQRGAKRHISSFYSYLHHFRSIYQKRKIYENISTYAALKHQN